MKTENLNNSIENIQKELCISDVNNNLFETLKNVMIEYCSLDTESSLESEINYHIRRYKMYIDRRKTNYNV